MALGGAITCPAHEGMHLRENHVIAEIIDQAGRILPPGEMGELVITTIGMEAMPLIRYRTGDYTRILPAPCPCGSEVLRLDTIRRADTEEILCLDEWMFRQPGVVDYRAERRNGNLVLTVLTVDDTPAVPPAGAKIIQQSVTEDDRPLYMGKRKIILSDVQDKQKG